MATVSKLGMAAPDAQLFWLSAVAPNDQFLLYAFDGCSDLDAALAQVRRNAMAHPDLQVRVVDDSRRRYPRWEQCGVTGEQFVVHPATDWQGCLDAVAGLGQLDATRTAWRLHVYPPGFVAVQIAHCLADGTRSAAMAAALLGRRARLDPVAAPDRGFLPARALAAALAHRRMERDIAAGELAPPGPPRPALSVNARPSGSPVLRTVVIDRDRIRRPTVTVGALVAVAEALGGYLAERGEDISRLGAEVPMALEGTPARNNFRNVSVNLHAAAAAPERSRLIAAELAGHRRRVRHPAERASAAAFAAVPAPLLRWGVRQFDPSARSATVAAHTVVSSVNRGPADLSFGGRPVRFTAGFPALSPMMSLTHGVHGIGDAVAVSVRADPGNVDVDGYLDRLTRALTACART